MVQMIYNSAATLDNQAACTRDGTLFASEKWPFPDGWPLIGGRDPYKYVKCNIVKWPFQIGWPLVRETSQKGFHCKFENTCKIVNRECKPII